MNYHGIMSSGWVGAVPFLVVGMVILAVHFLYRSSENNQSSIRRNVNYAKGFSMIWILLFFHLVYNDGQFSLYYALRCVAYGLAPALLYGFYYIHSVSMSEESRNFPEPLWGGDLYTGDAGGNDLEVDDEVRSTREDRAREAREVARKTPAVLARRRQHPRGDNAMRSGYELYEYLELIKYRTPGPSPLVIREVIWWMEGEQLRCYNTYSGMPGVC